jgi:hypothetical protein
MVTMDDAWAASPGDAHMSLTLVPRFCTVRPADEVVADTPVNPDGIDTSIVESFVPPDADVFVMVSVKVTDFC